MGKAFLFYNTRNHMKDRPFVTYFKKALVNQPEQREIESATESPFFFNTMQHIFLILLAAFYTFKAYFAIGAFPD